MAAPTLTPARLKAAGIGAFFRPRDLEPLEIDFSALQRLVAAGEVEQVARGLYRLVAAEPSEFETLAMVASAVPGGILCLLSALRLHDIGTQAPHEVWLAIDRKARKPARLPAKVRIVRFSGAMLTYGVETRPIVGVPALVTSPARTVVDCFRYRNKIGLDVALEALRSALRTRKATVDEITRAAEMCRARTVMRTYLEAL
ncbi:MAG: type IV toxin-antitoxin system AbiEi family antitoxin domain-containing protein [Dehalococcoidia bacterium]